MDVIHHAIRGDLEFFKEASLDIVYNSRDSNGNTVLFNVVNGNHVDCCKEICKRCPSLLCSFDSNGYAPLHVAAFCGKLDILKILISTCDEADLKCQQRVHTAQFQKTLTLKNFRGENAMHSAVFGHKPESVKLLIEADPNNKLLRAGDNWNNTPLHHAVMTNQLEIARLLIEADPDFLYGANSYGMTPLLIAIDQAELHNYGGMIMQILKLQPTQKKNRVNEIGWTALHYCVFRGFLRAIRCIILSCPEISKEADNEGQNFFQFAVKLGSVEIVKHISIMKEITEEVFNSTDNLGRTPLEVAVESKNESMILCLHRVTKNLHWVVEKHNFVMMKLFLKANADFLMNIELEVFQKSVDKEGDTILFKAAQENHLFLCKELYKKCPSLIYHQSKGEGRRTALHQAACNGKTEMLKFLIAAGAKSDTKYAEDDIESRGGEKLLTMVDDQGDTALHRAVLNHNHEAVKLLVEADPDYEYRANTSGDTPLMIALREARSNDNKFHSEKIKKLLFKMDSHTKARTVEKGWTLLHQATFNGDSNIIKDFIKFCPSCLELVDNEGKNFLHIAAEFQKVEIVRLFLDEKDVLTVLNHVDKKGNTPFHLAALSGNAGLTNRFLRDPRVTKTTLNKDGQHVLDAITFPYDKFRAGVVDIAGVNESDLKEQRDFDLLVGALIATVSFTAGITVPGGYNSDGPNQGTAVFSKKVSFAAFIISNTLALICSLYAVFSHFCARRMLKDVDIINQLKLATYCTIAAMGCMMVSFIAGSFAVLAKSNWLAILVCIMSCLFFIFACYPISKIAMQHTRAAPASQHKHSA